ncbi:MAG TPA: carbohydrate ABC transporter permease [Clostridiaceae bacterium]|nr:carbohydrate ABC transporter permease [Clostridiaceae bacterium]
MKKFFMYISMFLITIIYLVPFYILLNVAFKPTTDTSSFWVPPRQPYLGNFINAWNNAKLAKAFLNNIIITFCVVAVVIIIGSCAAYPLSRYRTKLNNIVYMFCISCIVVPPLTILVPLYKLIVDTTGTSTYLGIILPHIAFQLPMAIFLYTGFIGSLSKELDEAALIDGCSRFAIFYRIILPLLKPITATIIIFVGVNVWNDYTFSVFFLQKPSMYTITVGLSQFFSQFSNEINWVAAGCLLGMLPLTTLYMFMQQYFVKGLTAGAIKG